MSIQRLFSLLAMVFLATTSICPQAQAQNIAIGNANVTEGDAGTVQLDFPISLSQPAMAAINLTWSTTDGSATAGSDFAGVIGGAISIPVGASSAVASVTVQSDLVVEAPETLTAAITLDAGSPGTIVTNQALGRIDNDDTAVLQVASVTQAEGNASANLTFLATLSRPVQGVVSVRVTSNDDSATAPADYSSVDQLVQFASQATDASFDVVSVGESVVEPNERFALILSELSAPAPVIASISLSPANIFGTLTNDDSATISIDSPSVFEGQGGQTTLSFALALSAPVQGAVSVTATASDGTAVAANNDFQATSAVINFPSLSTVSQTFAVNVLGDLTLESDETVVASLSNVTAAADIPVNAVTLGPNGSGTLRNDDSVVIGLADAQALEAEGTMTFTVALTTSTSLPVTVNYATQDGTAIGASDFTETSGTLTFAAGETSKTITVPIAIDAADEGSESFTLTLSDSNPAAPLVTLNPTTATGTILGNGPSRAVPAVGSFSLLMLVIALALMAGFNLRRFEHLA